MLATEVSFALEWVELLRKIHERRIQILAFANNHYAGHGPATRNRQTVLGFVEQVVIPKTILIL